MGKRISDQPKFLASSDSEMVVLPSGEAVSGVPSQRRKLKRAEPLAAPSLCERISSRETRHAVASAGRVGVKYIPPAKPS